MISGYIGDLLNKKWEKYIRFRFFYELGWYMIYFVLCSAYLIMKRYYYDYLVSMSVAAATASTSNASSLTTPTMPTTPGDHENEQWVPLLKLLNFSATTTTTTTAAATEPSPLELVDDDDFDNSNPIPSSTAHANVTKLLKCIDMELNQIKAECSCIYLHPVDSNKYARVVVEIFIVVLTVFLLAIKITQILNQKLYVYVTMMMENSSKFIFILALICVLLMVPMRISCMPEGEDILLVISIIFMSCYFLYFGR